MHPLLAEPTDEQQRLLDAVYSGRRLAGLPNFKRADRPWVMERVGQPSRWPTFRYVESQLYREHGLDARGLLADFPAISIHAGPGFYGWLWTERAAPSMLAPGDELALTIAGMSHVADAGEEVAVFLDAIAWMVEQERSDLPSPTDTKPLTVTGGELRQGLGDRWELDAVALDSLRDTIKREPATWHCHVVEQAETWRIELSPFIRGYARLTTPREYVERVVEVLAPPAAVPEPLYASALSLPEAIDYLNAVWRLHTGHPLVRIARAEAAAKIALDCASADEFDAHLSALCGILDGLQLPDGASGKLVELGEYLARVLPEESVGRARSAVDELRAFFAVRVWRQHPGADRGPEAIQRLGLALPIIDWGEAWRHLQARAVAALAALREEVERLVPEG